jgi:hypothetical protein
MISSLNNEAVEQAVATPLGAVDLPLLDVSTTKPLSRLLLLAVMNGYVKLTGSQQRSR